MEADNPCWTRMPGLIREQAAGFIYKDKLYNI
jgi:hypothetical protein